MSAKLLRLEEGHAADPSGQVMRATVDFGNNAFRRRTLAIVLDQQRIRSAFEEWERWKKVSPAGRKTNR